MSQKMRAPTQRPKTYRLLLHRLSTKSVARAHAHMCTRFLQGGDRPLLHAAAQANITSPVNAGVLLSNRPCFPHQPRSCDRVSNSMLDRLREDSRRKQVHTGQDTTLRACCWSGMGGREDRATRQESQDSGEKPVVFVLARIVGTIRRRQQISLLRLASKRLCAGQRKGKARQAGGTKYLPLGSDK